MNILSVIGRSEALFNKDIARVNDDLVSIIKGAKFLIIGGAGSIGQAVTLEIFKRNPSVLHVVDISENNLVELVRNIRSSLGYSDGEFRTFAIDCGGKEFFALHAAYGPYDYVLNLSALKHVRSEKDAYTLMRMINVNIINAVNVLNITKHNGLNKYFCVSTDKAANPVNMMGASKRIMEMFLMRESTDQTISMARFANVAFSDGSLLHGFNMRFSSRQPISAPNDVRRYFVTPQESGELCLLSCLLGENRNIYFPKLSDKLHLITFSEICSKYLQEMGFEPYECSSEDEARRRADELISKKLWPCFFFKSDTTGEKDFEEFYTNEEDVDLTKFQSIGIINNQAIFEEDRLNLFMNGISELLNLGTWTKAEIIELYYKVLPNFDHMETGRYLDEKM